MTVARRLVLFAIAVVASFGIGTAIGHAVGPIEVDGAPMEHDGGGHGG